MSRKEMVIFLNSKGIKASLKDNTDRLNKKMDKYNSTKNDIRLDRQVRKVFKRIDRRVAKSGRSSVSRWMDRILSSKSPFDAAMEYVSKKYKKSA